MRDLVVVLGGTRGLGAELVSLLVAQFEICNVARTSSSLAQHNIYCDFSSEASVGKALEELRNKFSGRSIAQCYWVAGQLSRIELSKASFSELARMVDTNFRNPLLIVQWLYEKMTAQVSVSKFVVISSTAGINEAPRSDEAVYAATKAAQVSFARAIGKNIDSEFVKISLFCPGGMKTDLWKTNFNPEFDSFLEPAKVAKFIVETVDQQAVSYLEKVIPRGSL